MANGNLVIVGGGPAGLSAGIYAARATIHTVLLERGLPGGQIINAHNVENYPGFGEGISGSALMANMEQQARRFGLNITSSEVKNIKPVNEKFIVETGKSYYEADAVIVSTGARSQPLGVKGERELTGRGVSYCATCDGAFFRGKKVAVIGGGDAAIEEAIFLTKFAEKVLIIHRRDELRATKVVQQKAFNNPKIGFIWDSVVEEINGTDMVESLTIRNVKKGNIDTIYVSGVFIYIGHVPNSDLVKNLVKMNQRGFIITDEYMLTSLKGIYAAGDVREKQLRQVVTAVADGAVAAVSVDKYFDNIKKA